MGIFDLFKKNKSKDVNLEKTKDSAVEPLYIEDDEKTNKILKQEINSFFPESGIWYSCCFYRPNQIELINLPCHLRDYSWMSELLQKQLKEKQIYISQPKIQSYIQNSEIFNKLRHEYELEIVKWQIDWIMSGGDCWLIPAGFDDYSMHFSPDVDKMVRDGVSKTLLAIGIDNDVIEEGLEKFADTWRDDCMKKGFKNEFEPMILLIGTPEPADEKHRRNWIANREYLYYHAHKDSVDKYGTITPAMKMTAQQYQQLSRILEIQNEERAKFISNWKKTTKTSKSHQDKENIF